MFKKYTDSNNKIRSESKVSEKSAKLTLPPAAAVLMVLVVLSVLSVICVLWHNGFFLADWTEKSAITDLNNDGKPEELRLSGRVFCVCRDGSETADVQSADTETGNSEAESAGDDTGVLWSGREGWLVEDFQYGDIDRDGEQELLLLVWKRGSYGKYRPFWVKEDETGYSQHIFIYKWTLEDKPDTIWMSSKLNPGVDRWSMNENGTINILTAGGEDTVWAWNSWGLERVS